MIRYIVFTQKELDAIKDGYDIKAIDNDGQVACIGAYILRRINYE